MRPLHTYIQTLALSHTNTLTDFSSNRFDHIPQEVCDFRALVRLNFYSNSLRTVPDDLRHLENLRDLNLR